MTEAIPGIEEIQERSNLPGGVRFVRGAYWFLLGCGLLIFTARFAGLESARKMSIAGTAFATIINTMILYGLHKRRQWVVPLVLYLSVWILFTNFFEVVGQTASTSYLMKQKFAAFSYALFSIYQLYVFGRIDTKLYFNHKGQTLY